MKNEKQTWCYWLVHKPARGPGVGDLVKVVRGEAGYNPLYDTPISVTEEVVDGLNEQLGVSQDEALEIVRSSMFPRPAWEKLALSEVFK